jgi:hypothetical protein
MCKCGSGTVSRCVGVGLLMCPGEQMWVWYCAIFVYSSLFKVTSQRHIGQNNATRLTVL